MVRGDRSAVAIAAHLKASRLDNLFDLVVTGSTRRRQIGRIEEQCLVTLMCTTVMHDSSRRHPTITVAPLA